MEQVALLWDNVEEIEESISNLKSKVPGQIAELRGMIEKQANHAKTLPKGSIESALAYEHLEELDSSLFRLKEVSRPKFKTDMQKVSLEIEKFRQEHPQYEPKEKK